MTDRKTKLKDVKDFISDINDSHYIFSGFMTGGGFTLKWYLSTENFNELLDELKIPQTEKIKIEIDDVIVEFEIDDNIINEFNSGIDDACQKIKSIVDDL